MFFLAFQKSPFHLKLDREAYTSMYSKKKKVSIGAITSKPQVNMHTSCPLSIQVSCLEALSSVSFYLYSLSSLRFTNSLLSLLILTTPTENLHVAISASRLLLGGTTRRRWFNHHHTRCGRTAIAFTSFACGYKVAAHCFI